MNGVHVRGGAIALADSPATQQFLTRVAAMAGRRTQKEADRASSVQRPAGVIHRETHQPMVTSPIFDVTGPVPA